MQYPLHNLIGIIILLFLSGEIGFPQSHQGIASNDIPPMTERNQNYYFNQLNFEFDDEKSFNGLSSDLVTSCTAPINYYWWMIISGEKSSDFRNKLLKQLETTKKEITDANNDIALIFLLSFELRVHFYYNELFSALLCLNEINRKLTTSEKNQGSGNNEYFILVKNLVSYMNASINDKYSFYYKLLIHRTCIDKTYSVEQLKKLTRSKNNIVRTESNYFLMKIYFDYEQDFQSAEKYARTLVTDYPQNYIFSYYYSSILIKNHNLGQAEVEKKRTLEYLANNNKLSETQKKYCIYLFHSKLTH